MSRTKLESEGRQAEVLLNAKTPITIGGVDYMIGALYPYTSWQISLLINKVQSVDETFDSVVMSLANNIPVVAEIIALGISNSCDENMGEVVEIKEKLLKSSDYGNWMEALQIIFQKIDISFFFLITKQIEKLSLMTRKETSPQK